MENASVKGVISEYMHEKENYANAAIRPSRRSVP